MEEGQLQEDLLQEKHEPSAETPKGLQDTLLLLPQEDFREKCQVGQVTCPSLRTSKETRKEELKTRSPVSQESCRKHLQELIPGAEIRRLSHQVN